MASKKLKMQEWIGARKRHRLSHAQVQMARELGMSPRTLGKVDNPKQEPWKMPLPEYIAYLYEKRFGKVLSGNVPSVQDRLRSIERKKETRRAKRRHEREAANPEAPRPVVFDGEEPPF